MKTEKVAIPSQEEIDKLDGAGARLLLKQLITLIAMLQGLLEELRETLAGERHQREQLQRAVFGPSTEKVPPLDREVKKSRKKEETAEEAALRKERARQKREENAQKRREALQTQVVEHPIEESCCPNCEANIADASELTDEVSEEYEYVPAKLIRREHRRKRRVCACGTFLYGSNVDRVADGVIYGPGLHAHVAVAKCGDSIPIERLAKGFRRAGVQVGRSTLNELFHRTASILRPIYDRMLERVAGSEYVSADETTIKVQEEEKCRKAWMWTFIAGNIITYVFSASRSGQTPVDVLGKTKGKLQVDGYTGYNHVTCPESRTRLGCWSHVRRKFFEALKNAADEARYAIDMILKLYLVEYDAVEKNLVGGDAHRALRQARSKPLIDELFGWLEQEKGKHTPTSPLGKAIGYAINQKESLLHFLDDPKIRLDNNISERMLRLIALGRKNFLFVGHDEGGQNLAILQSLVSTCIACKINPQEYLADVIMRVQHHPQAAIDELLPDVWKPSG